MLAHFEGFLTQVLYSPDEQDPVCLSRVLEPLQARGERSSDLALKLGDARGMDYKKNKHGPEWRQAGKNPSSCISANATR